MLIMKQSRNKAAGIDDSIVEDSDEEEYLNRNMLMMPPSARGQRKIVNLTAQNAFQCSRPELVIAIRPH